MCKINSASGYNPNSSVLNHSKEHMKNARSAGKRATLLQQLNALGNSIFTKLLNAKHFSFLPARFLENQAKRGVYMSMHDCTEELQVNN